MLHSWGILLFSPCQINMLLFLIFSTISTLVRQLSTASVFRFFLMRYFIKLFTIKVGEIIYIYIKQLIPEQNALFRGSHVNKMT